ncbi:MAG: hypothetical protein K2Y14_08425 [Burkholderiales bacterium]|nr:hypothetical protein [Burkholderiales bacterium]
MSLIENKKTEQQADNNSIVASNSKLYNVGNQNTYCTIIVNEITSSSDDFIKLLPENVNLSDKKNAQKFATLHLGYIQNLDIDESIKEIYDQLHRICIKQLQDDSKYKIIKDIIKIVPDLTSTDLELIQEITSKQIIKRHQYINQNRENVITYNDIITKFKRLIDLSLIQVMIDLEKSNMEITDYTKKTAENLNEHSKLIDNSGKYSQSRSHISHMPYIFNLSNDYIQYSIEISKPCKVLAAIADDISNNNHNITPELEAKIWGILNTKTDKVN